VVLKHLGYRYEGEKAPPETPHLFIYFLSVENQSDRAVTLLARKWVLTFENGEKLVVEGDKIVGETPTLQPGEAFTYNSFHLVGEDAEATGAFFGLDEFGQRIHTRIPMFELIVPEGMDETD
jgi:ApaG protein